MGSPAEPNRRFAKVPGPAARLLRCPEKSPGSRRTEHSRQPDESWWCIRRGNARWLADRFFKRPGAVRVDFDRGAVQADVFEADGQDLLFLQPGKDSIQDAGFAPAVHPRVDGMPIAQMFGQTPPFAAMLHHVQQGVKQLQIGHAHIAALPRQAISDALILTLSNLHARDNATTASPKSISVNTP